jgi:hypothetical protein
MEPHANPILSQEIREALTRLGNGLARGMVTEAEVRALVAALGEIELKSFDRIAAEIVWFANLHGYHRELDLSAPRWAFMWRRLVPRGDYTLLRRVPELAYLFLFHRDGHVREAALRQLEGPLPNAFAVAAVAYRLNDWVQEVRVAAGACLARVAGTTDSDIIAQAGLFLLERTDTWRRWGNEADQLDEILAGSDVAASLAKAIMARPTGPMSRILRAALRRQAMDSHLLGLARLARNPAVRATALDVLIAGRTRWAAGSERRWTDKSLGRYRMVPVGRERPVARPVPLEELVEMGAHDRAAAVRWAAATGLINHHQCLANARGVAELLAADRSRSVSNRARFVLERLAA